MMEDKYFVCLLLFYTIAPIFQLHHGDEKGKPEPALLPTQMIFKLACDNIVCYTQQGNELKHS